MATRVLLDGNRAASATGFNVRTGEFVVIRAKAVILCCGATGRLGLPASGYLMHCFFVLVAQRKMASHPG